jgi:hypothetical protein
MGGLMAFLVLRMWLGKAVEDFNASIQTIDSFGPQLAANIGNAFTSACAFLFRFLLCLNKRRSSGLGCICVQCCSRDHFTSEIERARHQVRITNFLMRNHWTLYYHDINYSHHRLRPSPTHV